MYNILLDISSVVPRGFGLDSELSPVSLLNSSWGIPSLSIPSLAILGNSQLDLTPVINSGLSILGALAILVIGWIIATVASGIVKGLFRRSKFDEKMGGWLGNQFDSSSFAVDQWIAGAVFWGIMLFVLMAALNALNLPMVSGPIGAFLNEVTSYAPKILGALALLGVAWVLATIAKLVCTRGLNNSGLTSKLSQFGGESPDDVPLKGETLGDILYWGIFLLFLPSILGALDLSILGPVNNMVTELLGAVPNIIKAVLIGVVGWFVAKLVRNIVSNFLAAAGANRLGEGIGLAANTGISLSQLAGNGLYGFILLVTTIEALKALQLEAISGPATTMLQTILDKLPAILTAVGILVISYFIGKVIADLLSSWLRGVGFDSVPGMLGLPTTLGAAGSEATPASGIVGTVALVGIMLTAVIAALDVLQFGQLKVVATAILAIAGQVLVGVLVFALGLYVANFVVSLIKQSGLKQANTLAQVARIAILAFVGAMALQRIGIAPEIVNLAFGLLLGSIAVAIALAFGLGGRDVAGEQLREWLDSFK